MSKDPRRLVSDHVTGTLTPAERREIARSALEDQALFDELVDAEPLRSLLEDPEARQTLLDVVSQPTRWERARLWLRRQMAVRDLALVAAVIALVSVGAWLVHRLSAPATPQPTTAAPGPGMDEVLTRLFGLLPQTPIPARVEPSSAPIVIRPGARPELVVTTERAGWLLVLVRRRQGGPIVKWFPSDSRVAARVEPDARIVVGAPGGETSRLPVAPGETITVRVVVLPDRVRPSSLGPDDIPALVPEITIVDRTMALEEARP